MIHIFISTILSYVFCIVLFVSIPFRAKKIVERAGKCIKELGRASISKELFLFLVCIGLISVIFLRRLPITANYIIGAVSVLGFEIGVRNFLIKMYGGLYENGIFIQYPFISFSDIEAVPVLNLDDKSQVLENFAGFNVVLKSAKNVSFVFETFEDRDEVLEFLSKKL